MRRAFTIALLLALAAAASAAPMVPYTSFPGPMMPGLDGPMVPNAPGTPAPTGCASTGALDLSNTCNDIYILTGMF